MKTKFSTLTRKPRQWLQRASDKVRWAALVPVVALTCSPVFAKLPDTTPPTDGANGATCSDGDIVCYFGAYYKAGIAIIAAAIGSYFFIKLVMGAMTKWSSYGDGRATIGDIKEYLLFGAILASLVIFLVSYAVTVIA
jgi:hypothetical protein